MLRNGFPAEKFVDIPLPSDGGEKTQTKSLEVISSMVDMGDSDQASLMTRFFQQTADPRMQNKTAAALMDSFHRLRPGDVLNDGTNIGSLSYLDAMIHEKKYRRAAQNGEFHKDSSEDVKECKRRILLCATRGALLEDSKDLLFTMLVNGYEETGWLDEFPEEANNLLVALVKMPIGKERAYRFEFFDSYYSFNLRLGRLDRVVDFIEANYDVFLRMNIGCSKAFNDILKKMPNGDDIRMDMLKRAYGKLSKDEKKRNFEENKQLMLAYMLSYCIGLKADYRAAKAVYDEFPEAEKVQYADLFRDLVPKTYSSQPLASQQRAKSFKSVAEVRILTRDAASFSQVTMKLENAGRKKDEISALAIIEDIFQNEGILYAAYSLCLAEVIRFFVDEMPVNSDKRFWFLKNLLAAHDDGRIRLPHEFKTLCLTKMFETYYHRRDLEAIIFLGSSLPDGPASRGMAYFFVKAAFEDGFGTPEVRKKAIKVLTQQLSQFRDTEWEEDLWREYFLVDFPDNLEMMSGSIDEGSLAVLEKIAASDSGNHRSALAYTALALRYRRKIKSVETFAVQSCGVLSGSDEKWKACYYRVLPQLIAELRQTNLTASAERIVRTALTYDNNPVLTENLLDLLLNPASLNLQRYEEALTLVAGDNVLREKFVKRIDQARRVLKIVNYEKKSPEDYLVEVSQSEGVIRVAGDSVRTAYLFSNLKELKRITQDSLFDLGRDFSVASEQSLSPSKVDLLREVFSLESCSWVFENGMFQVEAVIVGENELDKEKVVLKIGRDGVMILENLNYSSDKEVNVKLAFSMMEVVLSEALLEMTHGEPIGFAEDVIYNEGKDLADFRALVSAYRQREAKRFDVKGLEVMTNKNRVVADRLTAALPELREDINFPADEEVDGLIVRYLDILGKSRDLDRPIAAFNSGIADMTPFIKYVKYLRIFNSEKVIPELVRSGVTEDEISALGLKSKEKNNFSGYYELKCYFEDVGEMPISIFLDENGGASIPGIDRKDPLYNYLWMLTLESMALKLVPEIRPYSHIFRRRGPSTDPVLKGSALPSLSGESAMAVKKRICCSVIVLQKDEAETRGPQRRLVLLDDICEAFNLLDLSQKDITDWPFYVRSGKSYQRIEGLFVRSNDQTLINSSKLKAVLGREDLALPEGDIALDSIVANVKEQLMSVLRVQTLSGRAYRMPVSFKKSPYEIEEHDGKEYFLVPADYHRGRVVERDGQLYRLREVSKHTKVDIDGELYLATPWAMSEDMEAVYRERASIEVNFEPLRVVYVLLYDKDSKEILAYTHIGKGEKTAAGNYKDPNVASYSRVHERGELCSFLDAKIAEEFKGRENLGEIVLEVDTNVGYRQGVFPHVWKYFVMERGIQDVAIRLLLDGMKQKLSSVAYQNFVDSLNVELAEDKKPSSRGVRGVKGDLLDRDLVPAQLAMYNVASRFRSEYLGLAGQSLYVLPKDHPLFAHYSEVMHLAANEVIVLIGGPQGRASRIKQEALVAEGGQKVEEPDDINLLG